MDLVGPLTKNYCMLFMFSSIFCLLMCILAVIVMVYFLISGGKDGNKNALSIALVIPSYLFVYLTNRLLYNMCLR